MAILGKPLDVLTEADVQAYVENGVSEGRTLDYKLTLPGGSDGNKKEFLADVTALANAAGGHILFGVEEAGGVAVDVPGVDATDADAEILRLDGLIRGGVEPRIPNVGLKTVELANGRHAVVLEVPQSFARPHMVTLKGTNRFYLRHTAGKAPMTVDEIRTAFSLADSVIDRVRRFRLQRLDAIKSGITPFVMMPGPYIVMHLLPLSMNDPAQHLDLFAKGSLPPIRPLYASGWDHRINFDGFVAFHPSRGGPVRSYGQLYRNGAIEGITAGMFHECDDGRKYIAMTVFEREVGKALHNYREVQESLGVQLPILLGISLLGVKDYDIPSGSGIWEDDATPFDRQDLIIPEVMIDGGSGGPFEILRPAFDAVWNAGGRSGSLNYGPDGTWAERLR